MSDDQAGEDERGVIDDLRQAHESLLAEMVDRLVQEEFREDDLTAIAMAVTKAVFRGYNLGTEARRIDGQPSIVVDESPDLWAERYASNH